VSEAGAGGHPDAKSSAPGAKAIVSIDEIEE
jgi:hypothetical protein